MNQLLRTYDWLKTPGLVALGAILLAAITNNVISAKLAPYTVPAIPSFALQASDSEAPKEAPDSQRNLDDWTSLLTERCPFGCADQSKQETKGCGDRCTDTESCKDGVCVPDDPKKQSPQDGPSVPTESDMEVKLLGAMVADNPEFSMAMIRLEDSKQTHVVSPGAILPNNAVITRIRRDRIFVEREDGTIEYIRLERTIGGSPTVNGTTTSSIGRGATRGAGNRVDFSEAYEEPTNSDGAAGGGSPGGGPEDGVRQVDGNSYQVSEEYLEKQLDNPAQLVREVRIQQHYGDDGQRSGVRLSGMKGDGFYSSLGFESGDVIKSVDGEQITERSQAAQIWRRFKEGGSINVTVERNGESMERQYKVGD